MSYIIYIFRFCRRFVGPLVPHVGSQDHGEHGRSTCEALRSKAWGLWWWEGRKSRGSPVGCVQKVEYRALYPKNRLCKIIQNQVVWKVIFQVKVAMTWILYTIFPIFPGKNTLKLGCDCSHFSRLCHETTWGGSSLGGDSFRNTSCSSGWQTIPGLKPPWRRWSNGGPLEWDMMTDDDSTSCERTTLQDQDIEKFSCNRHVLVTLFKTFTVAPSRTEKAPWQGLLTRLRGVGCRVLSRWTWMCLTGLYLPSWCKSFDWFVPKTGGCFDHTLNWLKAWKSEISSGALRGYP